MCNGRHHSLCGQSHTGQGEVRKAEKLKQKTEEVRRAFNLSEDEVVIQGNQMTSHDC